MSKWYEKSYRRNLVDMHIEDWNEEFLSQFDPEQYVALLKKAKIQSAMLYINSHVGYCNWHTESGYMHPGFKGRDKMGEVIHRCRQEGMDVIVYYSLIYNNWAYGEHPEWRMIDGRGLGSREREGASQFGGEGISGGRYGLCCPNSRGYREFVFQQIREFSEHYDFDGVFFDMTFWPMVCYCDSCRERYAREVGGEMPTVVDWQDTTWVNFQRKREEWMSEFAEVTTRELKKHKPKASVEHQFSTAPQAWIRGVTGGISKASDYAGGDLYGGYLQQSFVCKLYHGLTENQPFEYMTSRCYPNLQDHTTMKSKEMIALHNYLAMAHHGAFLIIDAIDPRGTMNPKVYEQIGEVFGESMDYEPYLKGELCQDVGVYFSLQAKMNPEENGKKSYAAGQSMPHLDAAFGASRILKENHIPYGVVNNERLEGLSKVRVLVLPDVVVMSQEEKRAVMDFVEKGGRLYLSGRTMPELAEELLGLTFEGETKENITYIAPTAQGRELMPQVNEDYPLTIFGRQLLMKGAEEEQVLATITLPYTDPARLDKFASIHSNPPGVETDYPAVIYGTYGLGKVLWAAAPLEKAEQQFHRQVFANMIRELADHDFSFEADAPGAVEITMFHDKGEERSYIHLVNIQEEFPLLPVYNFAVRIKLKEKKVKTVAGLPNSSEAAYTVKDGYVEIKVDFLDIHRMFAVEYEK